MNKKISEIIIKRIKEKKGKFFSNDNISDYIGKNELALLQSEVEQNVATLLKSLLIDIDNDHNTNQTPKRIAKKYITEIFKGRYLPSPAVTCFPNTKNFDDMYVVGPITVLSTCSHHFAPILGKVWIGINPNKELLGLSKFCRIVDWIMSKPQIQEEALVQLIDHLESILDPKGVIVLFKAKHMCMIWRGVKETDTMMTNMIARGSLKEDKFQQRFMQLIKKS